MKYHRSGSNLSAHIASIVYSECVIVVLSIGEWSSLSMLLLSAFGVCVFFFFQSLF